MSDETKPEAEGQSRLKQLREVSKDPTIAFTLWVMSISVIVNLAYYLLAPWFKVNSPMNASPIWEGLVYAVNAIMPIMLFGVVWGQYRRSQKMEAAERADNEKKAAEKAEKNKEEAAKAEKKTEATEKTDKETDTEKRADKKAVKSDPYEYGFIVIGRWISLLLMVLFSAFLTIIGVMELTQEYRYGLLLTITILLVVLAWRFTQRVNTLKAADEAKKDAEAKANQPKTQQPQDLEPAEWIRQLPLKPVDKVVDYVYIEPKERDRIVTEFKKNHGENLPQSDIDAAVKALDSDLHFLESHLISKFRARDYDAKYNQTLYRRYQISYMVLAALAGIFGALLALNVNQNHGLVLLFGFLETLVALGTTYLATISGRESPLQEWLTNRQKAEGLRREYQRYMVNLVPYKDKNEIDRQRLLKMRASAIDLLGTPDANETEIFNALKRAGEQVNAETNAAKQPEK